MDNHTDFVVSIITVTFNAASFIEQTIQSVIHQTYKNVEYIIVDGGSNDGTVDIIRQYEDHISKWVSEPDKGLYDAMNKGIRMATGQLIGIVNASDFFNPDTVSIMVDAARKNPDVGIFHGDINMLNEDGSFFKRKSPDPDLSQHYKGMKVYHPTMFVRKDVYQTLGVYDIQYRISADFDFILRCALANVKFHYIPEVISNFRVGGVSSVRQNAAMEECAHSLSNNGYSAEIVASLLGQWRRKARKDALNKRCYDVLRKLLPARIVDFMAANIGKRDNQG